MTLSAFMKEIKDEAFQVSGFEATFVTSISFAVFMPSFFLATYVYNNVSLWMG
jgi:hypothetical protein